MPTNKRIRIFAFVHHQDVHVELFSYEQLAGSRGGGLTCGVWVETEDDAFCETVQQASLLGCQGGSARGDRRCRLGLEHLGEIEIPLN